MSEIPAVSDIPAVAPIDKAGSADAAVAASNGFGMDLYQRLDKSGGNVAFSPASISIALAMTYAGAKGDTASQMQKTLQFPKKASDLHGGWATVLSAWQSVKGTDVRVANRLFGDAKYKFEAPFLALNKSRYGAPLLPVDFAGDHEAQRVRINTWVAQQTKDHIVNLIPKPGINADTRMVLVNALYFKAAWATKFKKNHTQNADFATEAGKTVKVKMMHQTSRMKYGVVDGVSVAQLGYKDGRFATMFVLPKKGENLAALEKRLDDAALETWSKGLEGTNVDLKIPRFKVEPGDAVELSKTLDSMGMKAPFSRSKADFTGITNPSNDADKLFIQKVFHKAFVGVDEVGTEAAAATAVVMGRKGKGRKQEAKVFHADRPFLFFVRDTKTGLVMFAGRVADPSK